MTGELVFTKKIMTTLSNLYKAFNVEYHSKNRNRYFSNKAQKDGFDEISKLYGEIAKIQEDHCQMLLTMIKSFWEEKPSLDMKMDNEQQTDFGSVCNNLKASIASQMYEYSIMYPAFIKEAELEHYYAEAGKLQTFQIEEVLIRQRQEKIVQLLSEGNVCDRTPEKFWACKNCGSLQCCTINPAACSSCSSVSEFIELTVAI
ncbi:hypothetical protein EIN_411030 [Entamoeba invadens IP1]|uniref:Ferritin-like diiron domain-containing protein n=1 Tax=Entamoeba invadens IP1 TaxID=370355 RepID=A0A0A1U163_ENTIV|nr:hypothetical protein EIN_411030 [Entamoeba invadens IP1]ELP87750.1 hypothetical protein EIN_411030 [Entamoeba invadens IP1]|eukprot:XP_004254521.1 hypothetical protein EIN_411030 [Entamoeba invadens IP1]